MIAKHIKDACAFHEKFNLGLAEKKQTGMFERNNLLLEELGELIQAIELNEKKHIKYEALDVYYILLGNCAYLGIDDLNVEFPYQEKKDFTTDLIFKSSKLAQLTRKNFDQEQYINKMIKVMEEVIELIFTLFKEPNELALLFASHHQKMMNKKIKKIGDVMVVSDFK